MLILYFEKKINFRCHHELVGSGRFSVLLVISGLGRIGSEIWRIRDGSGLRKWTHGHLWITLHMSQIIELFS